MGIVAWISVCNATVIVLQSQVVHHYPLDRWRSDGSLFSRTGLGLRVKIRDELGLRFSNASGPPERYRSYPVSQRGIPQISGFTVQVFNLVRHRGSRRITRKALLAGLEELFRPAVGEALRNALTPT